MKKLTKAAKALKTARFRATMQARKDAKLNIQAIQASNASHQSAAIPIESAEAIEDKLIIMLFYEDIVLKKHSGSSITLTPSEACLLGKTLSIWFNPKTM